jgi:hypothetical protein
MFPSARAVVSASFQVSVNRLSGVFKALLTQWSLHRSGDSQSLGLPAFLTYSPNSMFPHLLWTRAVAWSASVADITVCLTFSLISGAVSWTSTGGIKVHHHGNKVSVYRSSAPEGCCLLPKPFDLKATLMSPCNLGSAPHTPPIGHTLTYMYTCIYTLKPRIYTAQS